MYIFYLDDSGSSPNPQEQNLVLGGISVYERHTYWFTQQLDNLATQICPTNPQDIEFHASEIFSGRTPPWNGMSREQRISIIKEVLKIIAKSYNQNTTFACVIHKPSYPNRDHIEMAFEDLCSRFNLQLMRLHATRKEKHKGLIVLDESSYETSLQKMASNLRKSGNRWGSIMRDLAEVPLFANSKASRLIQVADHIAYAVFRRYEAGDTQYLDIILPKFDSESGILHGFCHKTNQPHCMCAACMSRP